MRREREESASEEGIASLFSSAKLLNLTVNNAKIKKKHISKVSETSEELVLTLCGSFFMDMAICHNKFIQRKTIATSSSSFYS